MRVSTLRILSLAGVLLALTLLTPRATEAQWISYSSNPRNILEGSWQSCLDQTGRYTERVYDHVVNGVGLFEVHLGPRREFAIGRNFVQKLFVIVKREPSAAGLLQVMQL